MKWEKLIKEFKNYLIIERNLSKNTIDSYLFDLKKLKLFLDSKIESSLYNFKYFKFIDLE